MPPRALRWLTPLFMAAAAVAVNGYAFGTTDQSIHLTFLRALSSPGAMAGDLAADHAAAHPSLWWWLQVPVVQALGWEWLPALYLGAWLLALGATFLLLQRLAEALHGRTWLALLAPALLIPFRLCPGHVHTFEPELINRTLAEPLLLGALLLGLRGRLVGAALLAGLAVDLHATTGVHLAVGLAGLALADPALRRRLPAAGFVFFAAAAPLVVLLARRGPGPLWVDPEWWRVLAWRMPHHLMPSRWPAGYWALAVVEVALFALGARALADPTLRRRAWGLVGTLLLLGLGLGSLVGGPLPCAPLLALHLPEAPLLAVVLAFLAFPAALAALARHGRFGLVVALLLALGLLFVDEGRLAGLPRARTFAFGGPAGAERALVYWLATEGSGGLVAMPPATEPWARPWSARALYVSVKDGGEAVFDRGTALEWRRRMALALGEDLLANPPPAGEWLGYRSVGRRAAALWSAGASDALIAEGVTVLVLDADMAGPAAPPDFAAGPWRAWRLPLQPAGEDEPSPGYPGAGDPPR
ncbi:MAG: hypothetical protein ABIO70_23985 [Pseudomonadota bacterium]